MNYISSFTYNTLIQSDEQHVHLINCDNQDLIYYKIFTKQTFNYIN